MIQGLKASIVIIDELSEPIKKISKVMHDLSVMMSSAYAAGYYIENRRGRNKLVPFKRRIK